MKKLEILPYLSRPDKWYLGGGNRLLWAPPFPAYLDSPGFWDEAQYYNYELKPLFTWTLLDEEGSEIVLDFQRRSWKPSVLAQEYLGQLRTSKSALRIMESKVVLPSDVAASVVRILNPSGKTRRLQFVAWTVQEHFPSKQSSWLDEIAYRSGILSFKKLLRPSVDPHVELACAFALNKKVVSRSINLSERTALQPRWQLCPWYETFAQRKLPNAVKLSGVSNEGLIYLGLHTQLVVKSHSEASVAVAFGVAPSTPETMRNLRPVVKLADPATLSTLAWEDHFRSVPSFESSDDFLTRYYWYRWYGLHLNTMYGNEGNYGAPSSAKGSDTSGRQSPTAPSAICLKIGGCTSQSSHEGASSCSSTTSGRTAASAGISMSIITVRRCSITPTGETPFFSSIAFIRPSAIWNLCTKG